MEKKFMILGFVFVIVAALAFFSFSNSSSIENGLTGNSVSEIDGEKVAINVEESSFEFIGGKVVGKPHPGTFEDWEGYVYLDEDDELIGISGVAKVESIKTDSKGVDSHLQTDDFFDSANYPEVKFTSTNIDTELGQITGILEIKGMQKELNVPAKFEENSVSGEFSFEADEFFKYDVLITEIQIDFDFVY